MSEIPEISYVCQEFPSPILIFIDFKNSGHSRSFLNALAMNKYKAWWKDNLLLIPTAVTRSEKELHTMRVRHQTVI